MGRFVRSPRAGLDLDEIFAAVADDNGLASFPRLGRARLDLGPTTYGLPMRPWVIIYDLDEGDVEVLRIVDGRRDLAALFGKKS